MIKNKLDYKLVNITLVLLIIFLIYQVSSLWQVFFDKLKSITIPILISFVIAYTLYPLVLKIRKKVSSKLLSIIITLLIFFTFILLILFLMVPFFIKQFIILIGTIITFVKDLSFKFDLDFGILQNSLNDILNDVIKQSGTIISNGTLNFIGMGINYVSKAMIIIFLSIYLLVDMDKIYDFIKKK